MQIKINELIIQNVPGNNKNRSVCIRTNFTRTTLRISQRLICTDATFVKKKNKYYKRRDNLSIFLLFLDYEKAYDRVNRSKLLDALRGNGLLTNLANTIKSLHDETSIVFNTENKDITEPPLVVNHGHRRPLIRNHYEIKQNTK
jgi:hypothetical protein